jgi:hypothetical protein
MTGEIKNYKELPLDVQNLIFFLHIGKRLASLAEYLGSVSEITMFHWNVV